MSDNNGKKYNWRMALINGGIAFLGVFTAHVTDGMVGTPITLKFWGHVTFTALLTTVAVELPYLFGWLNYLKSKYGGESI